MKSFQPFEGMVHLNGSVLCAIDIETTSLNVDTAEILEICILPLGKYFEIHDKAPMFHLKMRPHNIDAIDFESLRINRTELSEIITRGVDQEEGADLLNTWFEQLGLSIHKKIIPLGHNYNNFDKFVIRNWVGPKNYEYIFDIRVRDTMSAAIWINDRSFFCAEKIPFPKLKLVDMCRYLKIERGDLHTAIGDCLVAAKIYKAMMGVMIGLMPEIDDSTTAQDLISKK